MSCSIISSQLSERRVLKRLRDTMQSWNTQIRTLVSCKYSDKWQIWTLISIKYSEQIQLLLTEFHSWVNFTALYFATTNAQCDTSGFHLTNFSQLYLPLAYHPHSWVIQGLEALTHKHTSFFHTLELLLMRVSSVSRMVSLSWQCSRMKRRKVFRREVSDTLRRKRSR